MPQPPMSLMGAPRPGYRTVSNNLRMANRGDFGEYYGLLVLKLILNIIFYFQYFICLLITVLGLV